MKINRIKWRGYKGLVDGEIIADGHDVLISGRNGSGKSTLAEIIPFVLFGKVTGTLKRYDENGLTQRDRLIHGAEIEFDNGLKLRRQLSDSSSGGLTARLYVDGKAVPKRQFDLTVENLTHGAGELILNPFAIFGMTMRERRNLIARTFGTLSEREILSTPDKAELAAMLDGMTAECFIANGRSELRQLKSAANEIPARLEELERQLSDAPRDTATALKAVDDALTVKRAEQAQLLIPTAQPQPPTQLHDLERQETFLSRQLEHQRAQREALLKEYRKVKASRAGDCPTCGQPIPLDVFEAKRGEKLFEVTQEGKFVAAQIAELETELANVRADLAINREKAEQSAAQAEQSAQIERQRLEKLAAVNAEIRDLETQRLQLQNAQALGKRIGELTERERTLNVEIATLEGKIARAENFQHERIKQFEEQINANFEHVRFKLFDRLVDGTPREVCEAMIGGVPYQSLSKGEKLKAALDILRALQRRYGVELPLIIDDAESYTANSLVDVPNQKIILRVTEGDLQIAVEEGRLAA